MAQMNMIIIDSSFDSRGNTRAVLDQFNQVKVIGEFDNLVAGTEAAIREKPQLIFIDLSENVELGIETIEKIVQKNKYCIVFVTSENVSTDLVLRAMRAGAREFLTKPVIFFTSITINCQ